MLSPQNRTPLTQSPCRVKPSTPRPHAVEFQPYSTEKMTYSERKSRMKKQSFSCIKPTGILMPPQVQELAAEVLELSAQDRAKILELLLNSFEPQPDPQKAWMNLALQRREQIRTGEVAMVNGADAMLRVKARIA
ncbi:MAG: addiction module protein [Rhodoferax sp.]|nr:addiction module protein [Rhodoferax sp.]